MNTKVKYLIGAILSVVILTVVSIHLAPVSFDGNGPGFQKWIADKYTVELFKTYLEESGYSQNDNVQLISSSEEVQDKVQMDRRKIFLTFKVRTDGIEKQVLFEGKRYWIERYTWHLKK